MRGPSRATNDRNFSPWKSHKRLLSLSITMPLSLSLILCGRFYLSLRFSGKLLFETRKPLRLKWFVSNRMNSRKAIDSSRRLRVLNVARSRDPSQECADDVYTLSVYMQQQQSLRRERDLRPRATTWPAWSRWPIGTINSAIWRHSWNKNSGTWWLDATS